MSGMSYSLRLPEEEPTCECRWDEVHQRMDRDDCHFHFDEEPTEVNEIEIVFAGLQQSGPAKTFGPVEEERRNHDDEKRPRRKPARRFERQAEAG